MAIVQQIQKRMLVSLAQVSKELNLEEGDHVMIEERDGGIFLMPVAWIPKSQRYFWTEEWQEKMKASQRDLENGNYETFDNVDDLMAHFDSLGSADDKEEGNEE